MACSLCGNAGHTRTTCSITIRRKITPPGKQQKKKSKAGWGWVRHGPPPAWILAARGTASVRSLKVGPTPKTPRAKTSVPRRPAGLGADAERCMCGGVTGVTGTPDGARKSRAHLNTKRHMEWADATYAAATPETARPGEQAAGAAEAKRTLVAATPAPAGRGAQPSTPGGVPEGAADRVPTNPPPRSTKVKAKARSPTTTTTTATAAEGAGADGGSGVATGMGTAWRQATDAKGRTYWWHVQTRQSRWDSPTDVGVALVF